MQNSIVKTNLDDDYTPQDNWLFDIINTLWLKRKLLITFTLFFTILSTVFIHKITPLYTASTQLLIGNNSTKVIDIEEVISRSFNDDSAVIGEMEVIKSREIAQAVINELNLGQYPEFNPSLRPPNFISKFNLSNFLPSFLKEKAGLVRVDTRTQEEKQEAEKTALIDAFLSRLSVVQVKRSQVVTISYQSENPKLAAKAANAVADKYILGQLQAKFNATKKATDWLNDQLSELKLKVAASEHAVEQYRKTHVLLEVNKETELTQEQLSQINIQLIIARSEYAQAQAKYQQIEAISSSGREIDSVSEVLNSLLISGLRQQESQVQRKYSEMLVELGQRHPKMQQITAELADIQSKIHTEIQKIAMGFRNNMEIAKAREESLMSSMKQIEEQITRNNENQVQLNALEREADANKTLFETFLSRFKETTSTQGIEQADARVISFAPTPLAPSSPRTVLLTIDSFVIALISGVLLIFTLSILNPTIRTPEKVLDTFKIPTIGVIPKLTHPIKSINDSIFINPKLHLSEAINSIRISLDLLKSDTQGKSVLITSSMIGEGKSILSVLLAAHSAISGQKVVLVDTNFLNPTINKLFKLDSNRLGLTDLISNSDLRIDDVLYIEPKTGLKILARGKANFANSIDLFASKRMQDILNELRQNNTLTILDSPSVMTAPDSRILSTLVDKTVLVLQWNSTPRRAISTAINQLTKNNSNNIGGIVLQQVNMQQFGMYSYKNNEQ